MKELTAKEGFWFTQKWGIREEDRVFNRTIKGVKATIDYWVEVTNGYKTEWEEKYLPKEEQEKANFEQNL